MMYNGDKEQCDDKENVECDISDGIRGTLYRGSQWGCSFDGWWLNFADFDGWRLNFRTFDGWRLSRGDSLHELK